jgi:hypothetical protein
MVAVAATQCTARTIKQKKKLSKSDIYVTIHKEFLLGNGKAVHFTRDYFVHIIVALGRCIARQ